MRFRLVWHLMVRKVAAPDLAPVCVAIGTRAFCRHELWHYNQRGMGLIEPKLRPRLQRTG